MRILSLPEWHERQRARRRPTLHRMLRAFDHAGLDAVASWYDSDDQWGPHVVALTVAGWPRVVDVVVEDGHVRVRCDGYTYAYPVVKQHADVGWCRSFVALIKERSDIMAGQQLANPLNTSRIAVEQTTPTLTERAREMKATSARVQGKSVIVEAIDMIRAEVKPSQRRGVVLRGLGAMVGGYDDRSGYDLGNTRDQ